MGFFSKLLAPQEETLRATEVQVLSLAPAVMRMSIAGKDAPTELDALVSAVRKMTFPAGFSAERVYASAAELARKINANGFAGLADQMNAGLSSAERADAMRLALVAVFCSPLRDSGDIGILAGMAGHIGIGEAEFEAMFEVARGAVEGGG